VLSFPELRNDDIMDDECTFCNFTASRENVPHRHTTTCDGPWANGQNM